MKHITIIFNFFVAISLASCSLYKKSTLPTVELNSEAARAAKEDSLLFRLLSTEPFFDTILNNKDAFKVQIIYTQIDRTTANKPLFTHHYFNVSNDYFYPASTVKLPVAILALQRLNELNINGLDKGTTMITEAAYEKQTPVYNDPTTADGRPTIAQYIKKILLVSDNDAYNRLYEALGQEYINTSLHQMGYDSAQIIHRLSIAMNEEQNRHTNPVRFIGTAGKVLYEKPLLRSNLNIAQRNTFLGKGFMSGGKLVAEPFDFSKKNRLALTDLHSMVQCILFPADVPKKKRFNLTGEDYQFLRQYMSMKPSESKYPAYDSTYPDAYVKFLMYGGDGPIDNPAIRIFNKPGDAYGFLTDAAYIVDFEKGIEFMLSATIYCNSDGIFNDDNYDYETIGFPFMKALGETIYNHEAKRIKRNTPDLSGFKIAYPVQNY